MSLICKQLRIGGMTCINCQNKIERKLKHTAGITKAKVNYNTEIAEITFDTDLISLRDIIGIIENLDYEVLPAQAENRTDVARIVSLLVIIISLFIILQQFGILNLLVPSQLADANMGYGMLFIVGLITSVHCIAMCGGINLTQCIPKKNDETEESSRLAAFRPAFLYNLGRVISYTVIGLILGFIGMAISGGSGVGLPTMLQGILKLVAGIFMVIMGINMLGIFPWLRRINLRMPKFLAVKIGKQTAKSKQPLFVGLLNGLMPCGPLQSMQIVALATANPFAGALSMFLFSLGTVPLMLGLGSIVSALGKRFTKTVMGIGSVLVIVLGLAMLSQGGSLSGLLLPDHLLLLVIVLSILGVIASIPFRKTLYKGLCMMAVVALIIVTGIAGSYFAEKNNLEAAAAAGQDIEVVDGVQVVNSTLEPGSYPDISVQVGNPVRWVIDAPEGSINGCNYKMLISEYGIEYSFQEGENIIEFTPTETGTYDYTCWMGMIHGTIYVTDENSDTTATIDEAANGERTTGTLAAEEAATEEEVTEEPATEVPATITNRIGGSCCGP